MDNGPNFRGKGVNFFVRTSRSLFSLAAYQLLQAKIRILRFSNWLIFGPPEGGPFALQF